MSDPQCIEMNKEEYSKAALLLFSLMKDTSDFKRHTIFQKLVENMPNMINYVYPATKYLKEMSNGWLVGNTLLHVLVINGSFSIGYLNILLNQGADFTIKNSKGNTVIHELIEKDLNKNFITSTSDNRDRLLHVSSVLSTQIQRKVSANPCNKNGLTHFHVACMSNHVPAVEFFLTHGISINEVVNKDSPLLPGFTALHIAANYFATDVVKVLLKHNINVNTKDTQGLSPIYMLIRKKLKICVALTAAMKKSSSMEHLARLNLSCKEIDLMMFMIIKESKNGNPMEFLHAFCTMEDTSLIEQYEGTHQLNSQLISDMPLWSGYSALHFAAHFSVDMVRLLVKKGAQLELKDTKGVTPFEICLQRFKLREVLSISECHPSWLSIKTNLSSWVGNTFSNSNVNIHVDSPICAGYTSLHVAVALTGRPKDYWNIEGDYLRYLQDCEPENSEKYLERVRSCLQFNPDVAVKNVSGSTPLHLAFQLQESHAVHLLLENHTEIVNPVDANNLSHLHIACAAKDAALVKKLLTVEPDVNRAVMSKYKWCDVKSKSLLFGTRRPFFTMAKGLTALHFAAIVCCPQVVKLLIENGADVLAKDCDGFDPLETMTNDDSYKSDEEDRAEVFKLLIGQISKALVQTSDGPNQIIRRYNVLHKNELHHVLHSDNVVHSRIFENLGITPLHCACQRKDLNKVRQLLENGSDVNARVSASSALWPGYTPLHNFIENLDTVIADPRDEAIIRLLLDHGADVTVASANHATPLHTASSFYLQRDDQQITRRFVDLLLSHHKDFAVNPVSACGLSHFHIACFATNISFVEKFIEHGVDVNQPTDSFFSGYGGYSPLHFAAQFFRHEVVKLLLAHGADRHCKTICEDNALHSATPIIVQTSGKDAIESLIRAGVDVHAKNAWGETPLEKLLRVSPVRREEVDLYLKQNCRVNYYNPIKEESLLAQALGRDSEGVKIFDDVIRAADITIINEDGRNAIHNVVSLNPPKFEFYARIDEIDTLVPESDYISAIEILVRLGVDIDHQEQKGATPLHIDAQMQNLNGIIGLLNNGADINVVDNECKTAYAYTLQLALRETDNYRKFQKDFDLRTLEVFVEHLAELNFLNLEVSEFNKDIDAQARKLLSIMMIGMSDEFEFEVEESKNQIIGSVTLCHFLSETGAVSAYPNMLDVNRETIDAFFKNDVQTLQSEFPLLAGTVILQYRKAVARVKLIKPATNSLNLLVQFNIPYLCTNTILKYFTNEDLKNLIAVIE